MKLVKKAELLSAKKLHQDKTIVLFFGEEWCQYSNQMEEKLLKAEQKLDKDKFVFFKICPDNEELWNQTSFYNIIVVPTVIVERKNKVIAQQTALFSYNKLLNLINQTA